MQLIEYLGSTFESIARSGSCGNCTKGLSRAEDSRSLDTGRDLQEVAVEYSWAEVSAATGGFAQARRLGRGASGIVYRGTLHEGTDVAVKVIEAPVGAGFQDEVRLLSRCRHPNVVMLLGFAREECSSGLPARTSHSNTVRHRALVYELLAGGDAHARLHARKEAFPWRERLQTAIGVSRGLAHLHRHRPEIFHRDIKTQNILFGADGTAKIADFGLACVQARQGDEGLAVDDVVGTLGYADPLDEESGVVTEANEVYSFGMVLIELLTRRLPAKMAPDGKSCLFLRDELRPEEEGIKHRVLKRLDARAQWPLLTATSLVTFALLCIHRDVDRRPSFLEAATLLQGVAQESSTEPTAGTAAGAPCASVGARWTAPVTCDGRPPQTHGRAVAACLARRAEAVVAPAPAKAATVQRFVSTTVAAPGRPAVQVLCAPAATKPAAATAPKSAAATAPKVSAPKPPTPKPPPAAVAAVATPAKAAATFTAKSAAAATAAGVTATAAGAPSRPKAMPMRSASSPLLDGGSAACRAPERVLVRTAASVTVRGS